MSLILIGTTSDIILFLNVGTRIIYERKFLLDLKSSPLSQTPTKLPVIPGVTLDDNGKIIEEDEEVSNADIPEVPKAQENGEEKKPNGIDFLILFLTKNLEKFLQNGLSIWSALVHLGKSIIVLKKNSIIRSRITNSLSSISALKKCLIFSFKC